MYRRWLRGLRSALMYLFLAVAMAACQWPMAGFDPARTNFNPFEDRVNVVNVASLREVWSAGTLGPDGAESFSPVVAGGLVYAASKNPFAVQAFDAAGGRNCSGSPKTCAALWTGETFGGVESLAVANRILYAATGADKLHAFDAAGVERCSGVPATCEPLWTASDVEARSVVVAGRFVYATAPDGHTLHAFDAAGVEGCSGTPTTCAPLWSADGGLPSVANGIVYTSNQGEVRAFDARGVRACSGTPKTCTPLWRGFGPADESTAPTIAHGLVFIGTAFRDDLLFDGTTVAFDDAGIQGCSGTPKTCVPIWRAPSDGVTAPPAVAGDRLYVRGVLEDEIHGTVRNRLRAFDVDACSTSRPPCSPLWSAVVRPGGPSPAVANGVVYATRTGTGAFVAFDGAGNVNCSGSPKFCTPLVTVNATFFDSSAPVIANGVVYMISDRTLRAFALP